MAGGGHATVDAHHQPAAKQRVPAVGPEQGRDHGLGRASGRCAHRVVGPQRGDAGPPRVQGHEVSRMREIRDDSVGLHSDVPVRRRSGGDRHG